MHRDIWSQNVLLSIDSDTDELRCAKLADFGTAKWADMISKEGFPACFDDNLDNEPLQLSRLPAEYHGLKSHYSTCSDCFQFGTILECVMAAAVISMFCRAASVGIDLSRNTL